MPFSPHVRNSPNGRVFEYRPRTVPGACLKYYAERGLIRVHDEVSGDYKVHSIATVIGMARNFQAIIRRARGQFSDEKLDMMRLVDTLDAVLKQAAEQGDPLALSYTLDRARSRGSSVYVPTGPYAPDVAELPPLDNGAGRTTQGTPIEHHTQRPALPGGGGEA